MPQEDDSGDAEEGSITSCPQVLAGTKAALAGGGTAEVIAKEALKAEDGDGFTTFNFAVEQTRTYFVGENGLWVHNTGTVCQRLAASYYDDLAKGWTPEEALQRVEAKLDSLWQQNRISKAERDKHLRDVHDEVHSPIKVQGRWEGANESMSDRARDYQEQITGRRGEAYAIGGVHFDGVEFGVLLEVKGLGYATFVRNGRFLPFFEGADRMLRQARRQLRVANDNPIRWHVAEQEAATAIRNLFDDNGVFGIEVVHTPVIP